MKKIKVFILFFCSISAIAQVQTIFVKPAQTDTSYSTSEDSSAVSVNSSFQLNKLFLFFGGTGSSSSTDYNALRLHSANLGFDFINLSYPNAVAASSLANSTDSLAFDKYRQELCFGTPVSADVAVDSLNAIYTRILKLIQYLDVTYPAQNWGQYLTTPNSLDWTKIIVGGHSQGSGHASYLAKQYLVDRVLMFAGPNDYSDHFSNSANWLRQSGTTPIERHYVYLSLNDEIVDFSKQFENVSGLGMLTNDDTTLVDSLTTPFGNSHCLYTSQSPGIVVLNHNVPIKQTPLNNSVWTYMLTDSITTSIKNVFDKKTIQIFPNPTNDWIKIQSSKFQNKPYLIYNLTGKLIRSGMLTKQNVIDISEMKAGLYILKIEQYSSKIIKQ